MQLVVIILCHGELSCWVQGMLRLHIRNTPISSSPLLVVLVVVSFPLD